MNPDLRNKPKQQRSKFLVDSIKSACKIILFEDPAAPLTTTSLAKLAGVSVGSLYQYFPNIESVVAAVYEDLALEFIDNQKEFALSELPNLKLEQAVKFITGSSINFHRNMLNKNFNFHHRFHPFCDLNQCFNKRVDDPNGTERIFSELLRKKFDDSPDQPVDTIAYLMVVSISTTIMEILKNRPELINDPGLNQRLINMCLALARPLGYSS